MLSWNFAATVIIRLYNKSVLSCLINCTNVRTHMLMQSDIETSECLSFNGSLPAVWFKMKFVEC